MNRTEAAARATRAAESKGHTLGEWIDERAFAMETKCTHCGHAAWVEFVNPSVSEAYTYGGNATIYLCRPSGKRDTLTHNAEY